MLTKEALQDILHQQGLSVTDQLLICLAVDVERVKKVREIRTLAIDSGSRKAKDWNISRYLSSANGLAIRILDGWKLTANGKTHVQGIAKINPVKTNVAADLRSYLSQIKDRDIANFVEEAVTCYEANLHRAAIILAWVGAMSVLYKHIVDNDLHSFNTEALRRNAKWKLAKTIDDLSGRMKESEFLDILDAISVIGKNTKSALLQCLENRNSCGHPNRFQLGSSTVSAHIEILILNVFSKFSA